ncbi:hypothetical protein GGI04_004588 [Coemansia thaxteri]|uniref:Transmembrane protein 198 n=1 Tax=Coemansia thaxteri TaxID=2663907 RepID=A0A9W8BLG5_9FUNG|nr:hypothetical protein GGI04_004588 [Coemansia thaxteri]KAJ2005569.1 hypothetical protein H4R26_001885 [Coemansia thaxteri]KAJ2472049.1 hypothetical protein GGI02_001856 [Coemansia sp. RSA 2322]KAJ2484000.1 hypothetical protein EV174_002790 [Coemansia sp. RSA 2320]
MAAKARSSPLALALLALLALLMAGTARADDSIKQINTDDGSLALSNHGALVASGIIAGIALIVIGFFFNYFGYRLVKVLVFLAGFCVVGGLVLYAEYKIRAPHEDEKGRQVWYLGIAAICGLLGGALMLFLYKVGLALVGALGGFALASWILGMKSGGLIHSDVGRILFIVGFVLAGIIVVFFVERPAIIVASSIWGSYALFVGIDCFARTGFQYTALAFLNAPGAVYETSPKVYAMIAGMAVSACLGIAAQFWLTHKKQGKFLPL